MPVSASEAAYVEKAFDRRWLSLAVGLLVVVTAIISAATISVGSAGYVGVFLDLPARWIILGVVLIMGLVACLPTVKSVTFAGAMTLMEVGGSGLIIVAGLGSGSDVVTRLPEIWPAFGDMAAWVGLARTTLIAVFAFIGFEHLVNVAEEMKDPSRTLPRSLFLTLGLTALVYALVVWIALVAVPSQELARSPAPLALVFERLTGMPLVTMSMIAVVATLNGVIVHMIMIARVIYGLASQGNLPQALTRLNSIDRYAASGDGHRCQRHPDAGACRPAGRPGGPYRALHARHLRDHQHRTHSNKSPRNSAPGGGVRLSSLGARCRPWFECHPVAARSGC